MVLVIITELALRPIQSTNCKACIKEISSHTVIVNKFSASCMQIFVENFLDFKFKIYVLNILFGIFIFCSLTSKLIFKILGFFFKFLKILCYSIGTFEIFFLNLGGYIFSCT